MRNEDKDIPAWKFYGLMALMVVVKGSAAWSVWVMTTPEVLP